MYSGTLLEPHIEGVSGPVGRRGTISPMFVPANHSSSGKKETFHGTEFRKPRFVLGNTGVAGCRLGGGDAARAGRRKEVLTKKRAGRLPTHYAQVATPEQREKTDKIQEEYKPKIEALQSQIKTIKTQMKDLQKEHDEKIAAVLTPEQTKQLADAAKKAKEQEDRSNPPKTPLHPLPPGESRTSAQTDVN